MGRPPARVPLGYNERGVSNMGSTVTIVRIQTWAWGVQEPRVLMES